MEKTYTVNKKITITQTKNLKIFFMKYFRFKYCIAATNTLDALNVFLKEYKEVIQYETDFFEQNPEFVVENIKNLLKSENFKIKELSYNELNDYKTDKNKTLRDYIEETIKDTDKSEFILFVL